MTSNSYVFTFFVDEALFKRMITFPCETQFAFKSKNEEVQNFVDLVDSGLWCVHSVLALERHARWTRAGSDQAPEDIKSVNAMANKSASVWNGSVQQGMNTEEYISDLSSVAALLPARALQHLVKYRVLEHRDAPTMSRLEECCNTPLLHWHQKAKQQPGLAMREIVRHMEMEIITTQTLMTQKAARARRWRCRQFP